MWQISNRWNNFLYLIHTSALNYQLFFLYFLDKHSFKLHSQNCILSSEKNEISRIRLMHRSACINPFLQFLLMGMFTCFFDGRCRCRRTCSWFAIIRGSYFWLSKTELQHTLHVDQLYISFCNKRDWCVIYMA